MSYPFLLAKPLQFHCTMTSFFRFLSVIVLLSSLSLGVRLEFEGGVGWLVVPVVAAPFVVEFVV